MVLNDRYMEERDAWLIMIQMLITIPEFRKFQVVLSKLHHCNLVWTDDLKLLYYPKSFVGAFSKELAYYEPQQIAPEFMEQEFDEPIEPDFTATVTVAEGSQDLGKSSSSKQRSTSSKKYPPSPAEDKSDLFVLGMLFFTFFKREHRLFDYTRFTYDVDSLCSVYETGLSVYGLNDKPIYSPLLNQIVRKMLEIE